MSRSRRPQLTIAVALLAISMLLVPAGTHATRAAAATVVTPATGQITSGANTAYCLDNNAGNAVQGNPIDVYQCDQVWSSQVWTVEADGTLRIQNMCLDVHGGGTANGTQVLLNTCNGSGSPGEQWQPQSNGTLLNVNSHKCLGIDGPVANDTTLFIWTCDGNSTQVWNLPAQIPAATAAARLQLMYNSADDLFDTTPGGTCVNTSAPGGNCWWWSANELNALIDYSWQERAVTGSAMFPGSARYLSDIADTFAEYDPSPCATCTGLFTNDGYFDDAGWWGLTWLNAYNLTKDSDYLDLAESILTWINAKGWNSTCDGGVWQDEKTGATKDAIANELYFELAARLYRSTNTPAYLSDATAEWDWFKSSLIVEVPEDGNVTVATAADLANPNARLLVADHVVSSKPASSPAGPIMTPPLCPPAGGTQKWSYNQGVILGALHDMYKLNDDASYLTPAQAIANTVEADVQTTKDQAPGPYSNPALIDTGGTLSDPCDALLSPGDWPDDCDVTGQEINGQTVNNSFLQYKGVFVRNLACLSQDGTGSPSYQAFLTATASTVFSDDQDPTSDFGTGQQDLNEFGYLWDNNGNAWPGTETSELNEATQGSALDALVAGMGASYDMC